LLMEWLLNGTNGFFIPIPRELYRFPNLIRVRISPPPLGGLLSPRLFSDPYNV